MCKKKKKLVINTTLCVKNKKLVINTTLCVWVENQENNAEENI